MNLVFWIVGAVIMAGGAVPGVHSPRVASPGPPAPLSVQVQAQAPTVEDLDRQKMSYIADSVEELDGTVHAATLDAYMAARGFVTAGYGALMVKLGRETGMDPRLCVITLQEESTGGRGSGNLFGALGSSIGGADYETQVRWYFGRIKEISDEHGWSGDVWHIAWLWYGGGSSMGGRAESYAENITNAVRAIPWEQ